MYNGDVISTKKTIIYIGYTKNIIIVLQGAVDQSMIKLIQG